jgi:uncharacterized protein (TIGR02246 family)
MTRNLLMVAVMLATTSPALAQQSRSDRDAEPIRKVVADYNRELNACNVEGIVKSYEPDGIFMPPNTPAAVGDAGLRVWAKNYCSRTVANLKFAPVESQTIGDWGWLRVAITGTTTTKATGMVTQQDNKALFVVHRGSDGAWRISRYAINSNKPAVTTSTR